LLYHNYMENKNTNNRIVKFIEVVLFIAISLYMYLFFHGNMDTETCVDHCNITPDWFSEVNNLYHSSKDWERKVQTILSFTRIARNVFWVFHNINSSMCIWIGSVFVATMISISSERVFRRFVYGVYIIILLLFNMWVSNQPVCQCKTHVVMLPPLSSVRDPIIIPVVIPDHLMCSQQEQTRVNVTIGKAVDSHPKPSGMMMVYDGVFLKNLEYKHRRTLASTARTERMKHREQIRIAQEEEAERKAKEEAERQAREEAERKAKEEAERVAREEAERKAKEEAERVVRIAQEEAERVVRIAQEEAERVACEEAEIIAHEEAERKAKEEAERVVRIAQEEAERVVRIAQEEAERVACEEAERQARIAQEEAERQTRIAQEEAERVAREEAERQARIAQEEAERQARIAQEEAERVAREEQAKKESQAVVVYQKPRFTFIPVAAAITKKIISVPVQATQFVWKYAQHPIPILIRFHALFSLITINTSPHATKKQNDPGHTKQLIRQFLTGTITKESETENTQSVLISSTSTESVDQTIPEQVIPESIPQEESVVSEPVIVQISNNTARSSNSHSIFVAADKQSNTFGDRVRRNDSNKNKNPYSEFFARWYSTIFTKPKATHQPTSTGYNLNG